jgi:hypothetical protein
MRTPSARSPTSPRPDSRSPGARTVLAAMPLATLGAAALMAWWWRRRSAGPGSSSDWLRRVMAGLEVDDSRHEVLRYIRQTLAGLGKAEVRRLLGAPTAAADEGGIVAKPGRSRQAVADHWYYRLEPSSPAPQAPGAALVVEFNASDRASDAKFLLPD